MKKILLILLVTAGITAIDVSTSRTAELFKTTIKKEAPLAEVTATMYTPVAKNCDLTPTITAANYKIDKKNASSHKWIAVSRDLHKRWGGVLRYGDKVKITGAGAKDGIYTVADVMNKRYKNRIDILESPGTKKYKYTDVILTRA